MLVTLNLLGFRDLCGDLDSLVAYVTSHIMLILRPPADEMSSSLTEMLNEGSIGGLLYCVQIIRIRQR